MTVERVIIIILASLLIFERVDTYFKADEKLENKLEIRRGKEIGEKIVEEQSESLNSKNTNEIKSIKVKTAQSPNKQIPESAQPFEKILEWRVGAISNLVDLSENQKERLKEKFRLEKSSGANDPLTKAETLEEILGNENAMVYLEAKQRAKAKIQSESLEKEVLFLSRRLSLDLNLEEEVRNVIFSAEEEAEQYLSQLKSDQTRNKDPYTNFNAFLESQKIRRNILREQLKDILTESKFDDYLKYEAESSAIEVEMWHGG